MNKIPENAIIKYDVRYSDDRIDCGAFEDSACIRGLFTDRADAISFKKKQESFLYGNEKKHIKYWVQKVYIEHTL